jgi:hypothetical protein
MTTSDAIDSEPKQALFSTAADRVVLRGSILCNESLQRLLHNSQKFLRLCSWTRTVGAVYEELRVGVALFLGCGEGGEPFLLQSVRKRVEARYSACCCSAIVLFAGGGLVGDLDRDDGVSAAEPRVRACGSVFRTSQLPLRAPLNSVLWNKYLKLQPLSVFH